MKIGEQTTPEPTVPPGRLGVQGTRRRRGAVAAPVPTGIQPTDVARAAAQLLGRVEETTPDPARAAQLLILRNAVATGRYRPDPSAVARQLLLAIAAEPRS